MTKYLGAALLGCALVTTQASTAPTKPGLQFVDVTGEFDKTAEAAAKLKDDKAKVALFEKRMSNVADGFYARSRNPKKYDERVLGNLKVLLMPNQILKEHEKWTLKLCLIIKRAYTIYELHPQQALTYQGVI